MGSLKNTVELKYSRLQSEVKQVTIVDKENPVVDRETLSEMPPIPALPKVFVFNSEGNLSSLPLLPLVVMPYDFDDVLDLRLAW